MKIKKTYLIVATLFLVAIFSCKKDNSSTTVNTSLSFNVSGTPKSTNTVIVTGNTKPSQLQVIATFNATESLYFTITNPKVGSFDVSAGEATITYAADTASTAIYKGTNGTVTLTSYSGNNAAGTFEFSGSNVAHSSISITNGVFQTN